MLVSKCAPFSITMHGKFRWLDLCMQVQKLRLVLRSKGLRAVRVGTVDDYQVCFISRPPSLHVQDILSVDSNQVDP